MNSEDATAYIRRLQTRISFPAGKLGGEDDEVVTWRDRRHIATDTFTGQAINALRPPGQDSGYVLIELRLLDDWQGIDYFAGIVAVDARGIWWYDGDGHVDDPCWRPTLIPWGRIQSVRLHQWS